MWESMMVIILFTCRQVAAAHGHYDMCNLLLSSKADVNARKDFRCSSLHLAAHGGHTRVVSRLIEAHANVLMEKLDGSLPIHDAAKQGHIDVVKVLLKHSHGQHDAMLRSVTDSKQTPLHVAAKKGQAEMVRYLIASGAPLDVKDEKGNLPSSVCSNRRTLLAFPESFESAEKLNVMAQVHKRPETGDVAKFTQSLGISEQPMDFPF
mmetsp:Transcript_12119/g.42202  ORF Transcript_12119/g.42202 Transcript_12119/m.42202 type:complete len:207 (-) Transcript_12119:73-693(-)